MMQKDLKDLYVPTQLDPTSFPRFRDRIAQVEASGVAHTPRSYPGGEPIALPPVGRRRWVSLEQTLLNRRCGRTLGTAQPSPKELSRILHFSHRVHETLGRGPTPSSGNLQCLELFLTPLTTGWLATEIYHYDRQGHHLRPVGQGQSREEWAQVIPSFVQFEGGGLLWFLVGDSRRMEEKYGPRGARFLALEAGHLMQNLALLSASLNQTTLPLGGFFEEEISRALHLPATDLVLYTGIFG